MKIATRRAVAYIANRQITNSTSSYIYDFDEGRSVAIDGDVNADSINIFDYDQSCFVSGSNDSLYHYGNGAFINLEVTNRNTFSGYDYDSGTFFSGEINSSGISLYDYETGSYHNFSM